ncbi:SAM-dependent methyltransferase [Cyanobium sp. ATX 6A2]|uniref:class I SAM-dependent methyltransferase n=1 Tax=Cyanobium sp. ATX 6A2 TaxID=2823700 RepID=UPI0020CD43DC|nr:SAM-dependent methyltransferase [Cyanobium sp. ATX 6A2]
MSVPGWLQQRLEAAGGAVPFTTYMDWVLHDPRHGAYGSGRLRIGPAGDFATAPSLGPDFAALLAPQLADWLGELAAADPGPIALVEAGPGEGSLAADLAAALAAGWPGLAQRCELVLVEPNPGMAERQRRCLADSPLPCRWCSFAQLAAAPLRGVLLAHEVLDALPVERISWDGALWRRQQVALRDGPDAQPSLRLEPGEPLEAAMPAPLEAWGLLAPDPRRPPGWSTELHPAIGPWLQSAAAALRAGTLLVIDYALEARRYYAPVRSDGTLVAYRSQRASADPLADPGACDLTAHLCIDTLQEAAAAAGWQALGHCRQGQALLALGLAERLHGLQRLQGSALAEALGRREALLRLVDPHALGDFRWLAFARGGSGPGDSGGPSLPLPRFLRDPSAS